MSCYKQLFPPSLDEPLCVCIFTLNAGSKNPPVADFNDIHVVKVVELDQDCRTRQVNDGCFEHIGQVPTHALTLTIPSLMKADFINCVVPGSAKAMAVKNTLEKKVDAKYPATIMQRHPNAVLFLDYESSSLLAKA